MTRLEEQAIALFNCHRDRGFTSSDPARQTEKLLEEVGEFVAAVMRGDKREALMEAGDVAWLLVDMLNVMGSDYLLAVGMAASLDKCTARHGGPEIRDEHATIARRVFS
jgi:NTP pyrophosphatase (non-canonical NTP hydrolase)